MLGLVPNFLSRLRKKRRWCAFFSTASVWADHVRSSVMWTARNLKLLTRSTGVDGDECVFSALSPVIHHQLLGLVDVEWEVVLLSVGRLIVIIDTGLSPLCRLQIWRWRWSCVLLYSRVCTGSTGVGWGRSPAEHQCWGSGEKRCCCPFWPPDFCLSGSPGSSCTEICSVPESGASQPVWQALWC